MKHSKNIFLTIALLCLQLTRTFAVPATEADEKTMAYLAAFRSAYIKSMLEENPELIVDYYSEDFRMMPELQKTIMGKSNASAYHKAFAARFKVQSCNRTKMEVLDLGAQVVEIGKLSMKLALKATKQEFELVGTYMNIWKELPDGNLSLITEAWNYDHYYAEIHEHLKFEDIPSVHVALLPNVYVNSNISFELAAFNRLLDATVTGHDANVWSRFYADDCILIPNYHSPLHGKEAVDEYIDMHVKELPTFEELDIRNDRIDDLEKYVIEYASHIASWKNGKSSGVGMGKNIRIWRREPDHSLKLFRSMGMYD